MKAQFLKIAKCKTEKEFYKKYPTEAAFFKAHPEARSIEKAQIGAYIGGDAVTNPKMVNYRTEYDAIDKMITGSTDAERREAAEKAAEAKQSSGGGGGGMDISKIIGMFSKNKDAKYGNNVPKAQFGTDTNGNGVPDYLENIQPKIGPTQNFSAQSIPSLYSPNAQQTGQNAFQSPNAFATPNYGQQFINNANQTTANMPGIPQALPSDIGYTPPQASGGGGGFDIMSAVPVLGGIIGGIQGLGAEAEARRAAKQANRVSKVTLAASATRPEQSKRRYVTPWDNPVQPGQMFPTYGVGTNVLARDGVRLQGGGEIQNTYAPDYLYDDLGYEPLNDSNVKQYEDGGGIDWGIFSKGGAGFGQNPYGDLASGIMGNNNAGSGLGGSIGSMFGPVGGIAGSIIGGMLDTNQADIDRYNRRTKANMEAMAINNMIPEIRSGHASHMEDGGWVSHNWNPQVISSFGGLNEQEVYDYAHDGMESLRSGGHLKGEYTPISNRGMEQYAMGGEVQTTWGGHAETISHNPYMPGTGETIMFRGKSHDESDGNGNTGIGVKYGKGNHDSYTNYAEYGTQEADADVEVERGEPAAELQDATGEKNLTVYGNLKIPNQYIDLLGDKNAKGKKFKNYVNDLSKTEAKQNKIIETSTNKLNALDPQTQFDKLKLTSLQANIQGANMKLKDIADKKINAAHLQNAINDTAEENGLVADDLAKGKVKFDKEALQEYAEYGKSIKKAQNGETTVEPTALDEVVITKNNSKKISKAERDRRLKSGKWKVDPSNPNRIYSVESKDTTSEQKKSASAMDTIPKQSVDQKTGLFGGVTPEQFEEYKKKNSWYNWDGFDVTDTEDVDKYAKAFNAESEKRGSKARILPDVEIDPKTKKPKPGTKTKYVGKQVVSANLEDDKKETPGATKSDYAEVEDEDKVYDVNAKKRNALLDIAGQILPFFRPTDQESLDYAQLYPEMYAMATNQLEPVQAQSYQPDLATPYDISLQDQLNANQADYNATQKMVGYNPAALATLNAQKYAANEKVLGDQFRMNQAERAGVYDKNRDVLNQAKLANLGIFDKQYERQAQAKSNTKAVTQAALNSISDKYAKNKLENRELGIYENLYNYRYDPAGRAINMNAPWQANLPNVYDKGNRTANMREVYDKQGNFLRYEPIEETTTTTDETTTTSNSTVEQKKYGGKVKSKNGSIVSAYKNL